MRRKGDANLKLLSKSWTIPFKTEHKLNDTENGSNGVLRVDFSAVDESIRHLCDILTNEGWEIKSIIPLISGMVFGTALLNNQISIMDVKSYGGGYGYGASFTEGVIVLAQKWVEENNDQIKKENLKKESSSDHDSSILDLTGFEDNMNIDQLKEENPKDGFDLSNRILCSDGTCIGVINEKGFCRVCGKPYKH